MAGRASRWVVVLFLLATRSFGADLFVLGVEKSASVSTGLTILNSGVATASITFTFIPADGTPPQPTAQAAAPGQTLLLNDVLGSLWNLAEARGVVRLGAGPSLIVAAAKYQQRS